jgi:hypothetical protein
MDKGCGKCSGEDRCILLLLLLLPAIELSFSDSRPYTSTDKTNKNKYTKMKQYKITVQTIQNTVNTSTLITKTPTHYKSDTYTQPHITNPIHTYTRPHITKQVKTPQYKIYPNEIVTI